MRIQKTLFLDSDIMIGILHEQVDLNEIKQIFLQYERLATTSPNLYEIYYGIYQLQYSKQSISSKTIADEKKAIQNLSSNLDVYDMNGESANRSAELYHQLTSKGQKIDPFDCLIAGIILSSKIGVLLTKNIKHFNRIPELNLVHFK